MPVLKFSIKPIAILPLCFIIMVMWAGCSKPSTEPNYTYPKATLELLLKENSTSFSYPVWSRYGSIYYIAHPQDTNPSDLWVLNPETVSKRLVKQGVEGPIAISKDGRIALLEDINRLIVVDSTGEVQWQKEIGLHKMILSSFIQNKHLKGETPYTFFTSMC